MTSGRRKSRYALMLEHIFLAKYAEGVEEIPFEREDLVAAAETLGIALPKNLGDVIYFQRYRAALPPTVIATQPEGKEWIIQRQGRAKYCFRLVSGNRIAPNEQLVAIKVPDATPEIVSAYALSDEQALLAKIRYNRLLDIFLGLATYSLQSHLRTTVRDLGQVETDEIYVGLDKRGVQYVLPVQAKGGADQLSVVQAKQDMACCRERFPDLLCRAISVQFMSDMSIALFELTVEEDTVKIVEEKHYRLVAQDSITRDDLHAYAARGHE